MNREIIQNEVREILERNHAMISNAHLVLTNGKHSSGYVNLRQLAGKIDELDDIGSDISDMILERLISLSSNNQPDSPIISYITGNIVIVGPETMGRSLAHATTANSDIASIMYAWCKPSEDGMQWDPKLNFADRIKDHHCFIVDDVLTTAKSIKQTADLIRATGGTVEGAVVVVRRNTSITAETIGIPWLESLLDIDLPLYSSDTCPLCQQRVPMWAHLGHGRAWIKNHPDYPVKEV